MAIDFELSGQGPSAAEDISLADVQEAAVECGFTKPGVPASKPNAQRANLTDPRFAHPKSSVHESVPKELKYWVPKEGKDSQHSSVVPN